MLNSDPVLAKISSTSSSPAVEVLGPKVPRASYRSSGMRNRCPLVDSYAPPTFDVGTRKEIPSIDKYGAKRDSVCRKRAEGIERLFKAIESLFDIENRLSFLGNKVLCSTEKNAEGEPVGDTAFSSDGSGQTRIWLDELIWAKEGKKRELCFADELSIPCLIGLFEGGAMNLVWTLDAAKYVAITSKGENLELEVYNDKKEAPVFTAKEHKSITALRTKK